MAFPSSVDSFAGFTSTHTLQTDNHAAQHNQEQSAIVAIENKVGIGSSTPINNTFLAGNGTGTSTWRSLTGADVGFNQTTVLQAVYPVGCIYTETTGINPSTTFGFGTWTATGKGQVLVGAGTSDQTFTAGTSGGESKHTLTTTEMPSHNHNITDPGHTHQYTWSKTNNGASPASTFQGGDAQNDTTVSNTTGITINNTGGGTAHNNLQPYLVIYYWQRTA